MPDVKMLIGKRIRQRREELGLSQIDLAKSAGKKSATYIALIENGDRNVNPTDLLKIAKALSIPVATLMGEEPVPTTDVRYALQNDGDLSKEDRDTLIHIIERMKQAKHDKSR